MMNQLSEVGIDYTVVIAPNLLGELPRRIAARYPRTHAVVLTDNRVWDLYGAPLVAAMREAGTQVDDIVIPEGEASKSLDTYSSILEELHHHRFGQDSLLVNLGGGVITDLGGFVAASYRNGVRTVHVPTTLLAQQEAAFCSRAGINTNWSKNFIGSRNTPDAVYADTATLATLSPRDRAAGLAATIMIAVEGDAELFELLEDRVAKALTTEDAAAMHAVVLRATATRLCTPENPGGRGLGVPFAHALEEVCRFSGLLHGEAVAWGIAVATALSLQRRLVDEPTVDRIFRLIAACNLPPELPTHVLTGAVEHLATRRRHEISLPAGIGSVAVSPSPPAADVRAALHYVRFHPAFGGNYPAFGHAA